MSFISHLGNRLPIYLLVLVIGGLMLYYAFVYVPKNEAALDDHGMRVLTSKRLAITDKYNTYDNAVSSAPVSYLTRWYFARHPKESVFHVQDESKILGYVYFSPENIGPCNRQIKIDDLRDKARIDWNLIPAREDELKGDDTLDRLMKRVWKDDRGAANFVFSPATNCCEYKGKSGDCTKALSQPHLMIKISDFMENIRNNDFFDDLFVVRVGRTSQRPLTTQQKERAGFGSYVLSQSSLGLVIFNLQDSSGHSSSGIYDTTVFGKQYRVYYQMLKLRTGLDMYLIGLISKEQFTNQAKQVSVSFIVFCSLGALILIFSFPVLKLFLLDAGERLSTRDITLGVFSIVLCLSLCLTLAIAHYLFSGLEVNRSDRDIKRLASNIRTETRTEIKLFHDLLDDPLLFINNSVNAQEFLTEKGAGAFNEVFLIDSLGYMLSMFTEKGNSPDLTLFPVRLSDRKYFSVFQKNPALDYYIQSINSFASGKSEIAISKRITSAPADGVGVVTIPLRSILESGMPAPYNLVLLDESGDVKFHSDWAQINSENFLAQLSDEQLLKKYLKNGVNDYVDFQLGGSDCRGYLIHVIKDWSVLVYFEKNWIYNLSAQVFILCLMSLLIIVIFCGCLHLIIRYDRFKPVLLKTNPFLYEWLNPNLTPPSLWRRLFIGNFGTLIIVTASAVVLDSFSSQLSFSLMAIAGIYFTNICALKREVRRESKITFTVVIAITGVLFLLTTYQQPGRHLLFGLLGPFNIFVAYFISSKNRNVRLQAHFHERLPLSVEDRRKAFFAYRLFMMSVLLSIAAGPSLGSLIHHYTHEKLLTTGGFLLEDMQKLRSRGAGVNASSKMPYYSVLTRDLKEVNYNLDSLFDHYDSLFYRFFPTFASPNRADLPIGGSYIPSMSEVDIARRGDILQAIAETNIQHVPSREITRHTRLEGPELQQGSTAMASVALVATVIGILYFVVTKVTRKVFYVPKHSAWTSYAPPYGNWEEVEFGLTISQNELKVKPHRLRPTDHWREELRVLKSQEKQINRFMSYWDNLDPESKFFLYDLSEDGVANHSDESILRRLTSDGAIHLIPRVEFSSLSFANFVRTGIDKKETEEMARREVKEGRWKQARIILVIVILSALAFLSIAEQSFFGRATAVIGSIALLVPNLITLVGSVSKWIATAPTGKKHS